MFSLSSVSHSSKLIEPKKYSLARQSEVQVTIWTWTGISSPDGWGVGTMGSPVGLNPSDLWDLMLSLSSVRIELNCKSPNWCVILLIWEPHPTVEIRVQSIHSHTYRKFSVFK